MDEFLALAALVVLAVSGTALLIAGVVHLLVAAERSGHARRTAGPATSSDRPSGPS